MPYVLFSALLQQLSYFNVKMPPDQVTFCSASMVVWSASTDSSTFCILTMTFERYYSITKPHKAASFNTVKRAKIIVVCIAIIATIYSIPHYFLTIPDGTACVFYGTKMDHIASQMYYWLDQMVYFGFPFVTLLVFNTIIIHTLRKRSSTLLGGSHESHDQSNQNTEKTMKLKSSERQIVIMLLSVTFSYLILMIPVTVYSAYTFLVDYTSSPKKYAIFHLFVSLGVKTFSTNYGINFYLYCITGQKFRSDLINLLKSVFCSFCNKPAQLEDVSKITTVTST